MTGGYRCLSAIGMLGYGIHGDSLARGLKTAPDMVGCDAGSTDDGPQKLGGGVADVSREITALDLRLLIRAGTDHGIRSSSVRPAAPVPTPISIGHGTSFARSPHRKEPACGSP